MPPLTTKCYLYTLKDLYSKMQTADIRATELLAYIDAATQDLIDIAESGVEFKLNNVEIKRGE